MYKITVDDAVKYKYEQKTETFKIYNPVTDEESIVSYNDLYDSHILKDNRRLEVKCVWISGSKEVTLTQDYLTKMSIDIDGINGTTFAFGCLGSKTLNLGVTYECDLYKGDKLKPFIDLGIQYFIKIENEDDTFEIKLIEETLTIPLGIFIIDEIKANHLTKEVIAYDYAMFLDTGDIYKFPNYPEPTDIDGMINYINNTELDFLDVRMNLGIGEKEKDGTYKHKIINKDKLGIENTTFDSLGENFTLRGFIGYLAGLRGMNAIYDRYGELKFIPAIKRDNVDQFYSDRYILSLNENGVDVNIERLASQYVYKKFETQPEPVEGEEQPEPNGEWVTETVKYPTEDDDRSVHTFFNPMVNNVDKLKGIFKALTGTEEGKYSYTPLKVKVKGDPRLDINDVIKVRRKKKTFNTALNKWETSDVENNIHAMRIKMGLNAGCMLEVESYPNPVQSSSSTLSGSISSKVETVTAMTKGMFNDIYGVNAKIGELYAGKAKINSLVVDTLVGDTGTLNSALIKTIDAGEIDVVNLNADNITSGTIKIKSDDDDKGIIIESIDENVGSLVIKDGSIQIGDENEILRVLIGRFEHEKEDGTTHADYNLYLWNSNGDPIFSADGLTEHAIPNGLITNNMISGESDRITSDKIDVIKQGDENANLTETITSLRQEIKQSTTDVNGNITNLETTINKTIDGISTRVEKVETEFGEDGRVSKVEKQQSSLEQTVGQIKSEVFIMDTDGNVSKSKIQQNADNIELKVSKDGVINAINISNESVKIDANKVEIDGDLVISAIDGASTTISGNKITTGSIKFEHLDTETQDTIKNNEVSQEDVFNALTNNGQWKGIYTDSTGNMYMNADYINSGTIRADLIKVNVDSDNLLPHPYMALNSHINEDAYITMDYFLDDENNHIPAVQLRTPNTIDSERYIVRQLSNVPITLKEGHWYYFTVDILANWDEDTRLSLMYPEDPFNFDITYPISPSGNGVTGSFGTANGNSLTMFLANSEDDFNNGNGNYIELMEIPDFDTGIEMQTSGMTRGADGQILRKITTKKFATKQLTREYTGSLWYEMEFSRPIGGLTVYISGMQLFDSSEFSKIEDVTPFNYYKEIREKHIELSDDKFYKGTYSVDGISLQEGTVQGNSDNTNYKYRLDYNGLYHGSQSNYNQSEHIQVGINRLWRANYNGYNSTTGHTEFVPGHDCYGYGFYSTIKVPNLGERGIFCGIHGEYEDPQNERTLGRPDIYILDFLNNYDHSWKLLGAEVIPNGLVRRNSAMNISTQNQLIFNESSALISIANKPYDLGSLFGEAAIATINDDEGNPVQIKQSPLITEVQQLKQENEDLKRRIEALEEIIKNMQ